MAKGTDVRKGFDKNIGSINRALGIDGSLGSNLVGTVGKPLVDMSEQFLNSAERDARPVGTYSGGGSYDAAAARQAAEDAKEAAARGQLRGEISARGGEIDAIYNELFGALTQLVKSRGTELESQYGDQFKKAADAFASALPEIENSYAAIGAADSTDQSDSKDKAKGGYDETTKTIGKNKQDDLSKLGAYEAQQKTRISGDKDNAQRNVARAGAEENVDSLRSMRNDLESGITSARNTKAELITDGGARQSLSTITGDAGRYDQAINALDSLLKSSMSGSVKEAAVQAITNNSGLSDDEKKKVDQQYGKVYAEQAAL